METYLQKHVKPARALAKVDFPHKQKALDRKVDKLHEKADALAKRNARAEMVRQHAYYNRRDVEKALQTIHPRFAHTHIQALYTKHGSDLERTFQAPYHVRPTLTKDNIPHA